uniref:Diazepam-binding inhibitor-like 5 n=1 Tax=Jaculus jaculus TaxID=51337 RepID=A0A8C5KLH9_JACJA|nr:diazepam-binding inhibitor-like 5 [Jaculus jaculus]
MTQVEFELACAALKQLKGPVSDQDKLLVYSYYKQATQGDCNIPVPPATEVKAKAKWVAWNQNKGMSRMDAMRFYIAKVEELKKKEAAQGL